MLMPNSKIAKPLRHAALCLTLLTALFAGGLAVPASAQDTLRIAAVVNDDIISELDVFMRLRMAMLSAKLEDNEETRRRLLPQVLRNLIDDRLKMQEAKRTGVKVNPADVESRIDRLAERNNMTRVELDEFLKGNGILVDAVADQITAELNWARLVQRTLRPRIVITDQEINEEAQRIKATQGQTEYKIYQIFLAVDAPDQESDVRDSGRTADRAAARGRGFRIPGAGILAGRRRDEGRQLGLAAGGPDGARRRQADPDGRRPATWSGRCAAPADTTSPWRGRPASRGPATPPAPAASRSSRSCGRCRPTRRKAKSTARSPRPIPSPARSRTATRCPRLPTRRTPASIASSAACRSATCRSRCRRIAINQPVDVPSRPVRTNQGVGLYMICARQGADEDSQSRTAIADRLGQQRLETLARGYLSDLRRAAVIDIRM